MTLRDYIRQIGTRAFAERFGITYRAACSYRWRDRRPRPELARRIVAETPVTWDEIYAEGALKPSKPAKRAKRRARARR